ncbi:MAG TPA: class I SAM-dependent methyltransferase [Candidatus Bathyarchaeota archaeon]|nr:class I SAM-dependent methyltransferase [Candidatus Bathyarchaeota archaeon]
MSWSEEYRKTGKIWGERPGELAIIALNFLKKHNMDRKGLTLLDVGCGYGRDSIFFAKNMNCQVLGIDISREAIEMAKKSYSHENLMFLQCDFAKLRSREGFDVIFVSNLYHLLRREMRLALRRMVMELLKPNGFLFLNALSVRDPQHYGKGVPVPDEPNSFVDRVYMHFFTEEELRRDFGFLEIRELYEHEYYEHRAGGVVHHHVSWILIAERR